MIKAKKSYKNINSKKETKIKEFNVFFNQYQIVKNNAVVFIDTSRGLLKTKAKFLPYKKKQKPDKKYGKRHMLTTHYYGNKKGKKHHVLTFGLAGIIIGFINGFWGGGGGMVCVPTLTNIFKLPEKKAHATAILIMLPLSFSSLMVYFFGGTINWGNASIIAAGFVGGGIVGALLLKRINSLLLKLIFSLIIIAGAIRLLI